MSGIVRQEGQLLKELDGVSTVFDRVSCGDEFPWNDSVLEIETEDLQCCSLIVTDLLADDLAMQSTAQI